MQVQTSAGEHVPLKIKTFSNTGGSSCFFKAIGHPVSALKMSALIQKLAHFKSVAVYDPQGFLPEIQTLYDISSIKITDVYVQNIIDVENQVLGLRTKPINSIQAPWPEAVFVTAFDAGRVIDPMRHFLKGDIKIFSLDEVRLEDDFLSNTRNYLDPLNFATNFVFFREEGGHHTRLVTANYWSGYTGKNISLWCCLFDGEGKELSRWKQSLTVAPQTIVLDSKEIKERFGLGDFTGSLFVHFTQVAVHDIVKYALDTYGDDPTVISCTHDANSWPADLYAGLPAPHEGEKVLLWIQNSHPCWIPPGGIALSIMGQDHRVLYDKPIAPFAVCAIDTAVLFPEVFWPQQFEVHAGRYCVRPRYEVLGANGRHLMAHTNVERTDLATDLKIQKLDLMGKGYILPAPLLDHRRWKNIFLPTPMSTGQKDLPLSLLVYNKEGEKIAQHFLGKIERSNSKSFNVNDMLSAQAKAKLDFGHMELVYDFSQGGGADGWLHSLFRYEDTITGHAAETSFGAHIFNTVLVYKNEPQSYSGKPPGLTTRLFLRLGHEEDLDSLCHLIYPASTPWHPQSQTDLVLFDRQGVQVAKKTINIPCSGSLHWRYHDVFNVQERQKAGPDAYIIIRDTTCRLFGYHGLIRDKKAFSLDHMFGF